MAAAPPLRDRLSFLHRDLGSALFSDAMSPLPAARTLRPLPSAGMGSQPQPHSALQGFGYSQETGRASSAGEALLSTIQKAAEVVANAMRPGHEWPSSQRPASGGDTYQPAVTPPACPGHPPPRRPSAGVSPGARATRHQPGQPGGGWEEPDSSPSSQGSSQENGIHSQASDSSSGCRALCALSALGGADLLSQEYLLLLARPSLQELSAGIPGPVTSKATKILRHFEASCRHRPTPWGLLGESDPAGPQEARACPPDLLTDAEPLMGGQPSLQPLSSISPLPEGPPPAGRLQPSPAPTLAPRDTRPGGKSTREAEKAPAGFQGLGAKSETTDGGLESGTGPAGCQWAPAASSSNSLFAGMELVACARLLKARASAEKPLPAHSAPEAPRTLPPRAAAQAPPASELSAFEFLNA
ncbi:AP-4 complex accessory subunit tepsin [Orycteropus afer afer]|uniref:AP-4 complex accessory subunit tepsin n=1 Tax=Orycteropus afer afer TaxID=1230840 RepID=A0A8B7BEU8_ORYAF|nr:AP-4 complex accessory subunit tepsin [Orycteropus afer afer]